MAEGFSGRLHLVNPRYSTLHELPCYPNLKAIGERVDHVVIVVAAEQVTGVVEEAGRLGIRSVTVISGGFAELGTESGRRLQLDLEACVRRHGIRLLGPNCAGWTNFESRCAVTLQSTMPPRLESNSLPALGIACTSGGVAFVNMMWGAVNFGLAVKYVVSCGNEIDLTPLDFVHDMLDDPQLRVVLAELEQVKDVELLRQVGEKSRRTGKPVILIRLGRTKVGQVSAQSHTGAVAADDAIVSSLLQQFGILQVDSFREMNEIAMLFACGKKPRGIRFATVSVSGGNVGIFADRAAQHGLVLADLTQASRERIKRLLPAHAGEPRNPVDLAAASAVSILREAVQIVSEDPNVDVTVPIVTHGQSDWISGMVELFETSDAPIVLVYPRATSFDASIRPDDIVRRGVPCFADLDACARTLSIAARFSSDAMRTTADAAKQDAAPLSESDANGLLELAPLDLLAHYGLPLPRQQSAPTAAQAACAAAEIGFPVAVKLISDRIAHKADVDGVKLNLGSENAVLQACEEIAARSETARKGDPANYLVQQMVLGGYESALGIVNEPTLGAVVMIGQGGPYMESLRDVGFLAAPFTAHDVERALAGLRCARAFDWPNGKERLDKQAFVSAALKLGRMAVELGRWVGAVDVNPIIVGPTGRGALVVDAWLERAAQQ